jgi:hypothetical protein
MFVLSLNNTAMKTILTLVLLLTSVTVFAKAPRKSEVRFTHMAQTGLAERKDASQWGISRVAEKRMPGRKRVCVGFTAAMPQNREVKTPLTLARRERGVVGETLSHLYLKNGTAGYMGSWVNNVQFTFGWRYQPLRVLTSENPVPVHPLVMRVRVRI